MSGTIYSAPLLDGRGALDTVEPVTLTDCGWPVGNSFCPLTSFRCGVLKGQGLLIRLFTQEPEPRAIYTERDDPVWTDSCLEFFFQAKRGGDYVNLEMNANGAYLSAVGAGRADRRFLRSFTDLTVSVTPFRQPDGWGVEAFVPFALASACFGEPFSLAAGDVFFANAYKCADDAPQPHYQSLFPVRAPQPDFHRPEWFGTILVTESGGITDDRQLI